MKPNHQQMIVAVASGKGGTGKTTVSLSLARVFGSPVQLLDCDVEEPNVHLFLPGPAIAEKTVGISIPQVDEKLCTACGDCSRFCQYHAIALLGGKTMVLPELCHGCGGCALVCPQQAIREQDQRVGVVSTFQAGDITLIQGEMDVGVAMAPPLVRAVKAGMRGDLPAILDAPPGTSCPVVAALRGADFVILVAEPTPFGLHDLKLAVDMVRELGLPFGVAVNRMGAGDDRVHRFCRQEGIHILAEIPDDRRIAEAYSRGELVVDALPDYRKPFRTLWARVRSRIEAKRGTPPEADHAETLP